MGPRPEQTAGSLRDPVYIASLVPAAMGPWPSKPQACVQITAGDILGRLLRWNCGQAGRGQVRVQ